MIKLFKAIYWLSAYCANIFLPYHNIFQTQLIIILRNNLDLGKNDLFWKNDSQKILLYTI